VSPFLAYTQDHTYLGTVPFNQTEKIFKNISFTDFQGNFSIFSDKNNHHSNIRRNMFDVKKNLMFELIL